MRGPPGRQRVITFDHPFTPGWKPVNLKVQLSPIHTLGWLGERVMEDITHTTTDARIGDLVDAYEADANAVGYTLHPDLARLLRERRDRIVKMLMPSARHHRLVEII